MEGPLVLGECLLTEPSDHSVRRPSLSETTRSGDLRYQRPLGREITEAFFAIPSE